MIATETTVGQESVLFLVSQIKSHFLPSFFLAEKMMKRYKVVYGVANDLNADLVIRHGFHSIVIESQFFAQGLEMQDIAKNGLNTNIFRVIKSIYSNKIYHRRQRELHRVIQEIKPKVIFIDKFTAGDFIVLFPYQSSIKLIFINPMLSAYKADGIPGLPDLNWHPSPLHAKAKNEQLTLMAKAFNKWLEWTVLWQLSTKFRKNKINKLYKIVDRKVSPYVTSFHNVPELVLGPSELEFSPKVIMQTQFYLGLCVGESRPDESIDPTFRTIFDVIKRNKEGRRCRVIYCSFGSYYKGSDMDLFTFITRLCEAITEVPDVNIICSVNDTVIRALHAQKIELDNVHFFTWVPQLEVLEITDLYITHGGLGSIKESIHYQVPMLVYPLDSTWDQPSNGLRIEFYKLGLRGDFHVEHEDDMRNKILILLDDKQYRSNIEILSKQIQEKYSDTYVQNILDQML